MRTIVWRDTARADLADILDFIASDNPDAADRLKVLIESTIDRLAEHPLLYRVGRAPRTREIVVHPNYLVIYRVLPNEVEIVKVLHARRRYP